MIALRMSELATLNLETSVLNDRQQLMRRGTSAHNSTNLGKDGRLGSRKLRVLVVNYAQGPADALARLLRRWGHALRLACDGRATPRVPASQIPDVVLLDLDKPFTDGCQVARRLRLDFLSKGCFIIAMTERVDDQRRQRCLEAGIDLLLSKPVDPAVLGTLLMLECELVNRSPAEHTAGLVPNCALGSPADARWKALISSEST